ncbi:PD40 domain-containing protein [Leptospira sp. 201903070]|uniref:PD40 domain-containing protein n=1 Tax=Leptospira ainlahdjerensis TaxID=2810033 RepID=A0ABS2UHE2_9LEPT|nr:PD40 domain-containing protein [Leptospira ainlahdjerensis]MBM9579806.1 PD40 domain-containing protein [Leptospira ainlahdjerensis]
MIRFSWLFGFIFLYQCALLKSSAKIKPLEFNYSSIAVNYFTPENEKPFPLTVQRGNNLYNSATADGRYLFYTTGQKGNYDIWFRDLKSSITVPVTEHPAPELKPAISPDGTKLVFVSEQYDSSGDIVLLEMDPSYWAEKILQGKRFLNSDFVVLTNPNFSDSGKKDGFVDTDPSFSPDNRRVVFSSDRLSPGVQNLVVLDTDEKEPMRLLTQNGGTSPVWSADGKTITYLSYESSNTGDIYLLDVASGKKERVTSDPYLNFSPSLSTDNRYLFYTSIRNDTNKNGRLDERDNSLIVRKDLKTGVARQLTSGNDSLFDSKFSSFNGGSVLFTAAYYNTLNIYFIPASGSVSKEKDIISQYELALQYRDKQSFEDFLLAIDAIDFYFSQDPIFPLIHSKSLLLKYKEARDSGRSSVAENVKKEIFSTRLHPSAGLAYGLFLAEERKSSNGSAIQELKKYYEQIKTVASVSANVLASLLEEEADLSGIAGDLKTSLKLYQEILNLYPSYYRIRDIYRKSGDLQFKNASIHSYKIPETFYSIANDPNAGKEDLKLLYAQIDRELLEGKNFSERMSAADAGISTNFLEKKSPRLFQYFLYIKALGLNGKGSFEESNSLMNSFLSSVAETDPLFLKGHLLKSDNFKGLGEVQKSFDELRIYLEKYDPLLGVDLEEKEIERSFIYFENKARDHDRRGNLQDAAFHYFYNTENMFLVKSRNLFLETLYKEYAVYYQRMMVDAVFKLAGFLSEEKQKALLKQIDIIDIASVDPLAEEGLAYINQYYKIAVPRSRPVLDLATLYGYSYYLVNRSVIRESYYNAADSMTSARKEEILRDFKQAEYELRWIIFADPRYYEAYQLLGWMYQYIDILKGRKSGEDQPTDEEKYSGVYKKYFPEKNFEENIELYSQVLELLGENFENKKALSDLRLNLGNNYFLLKNYPRANEQYSKVDSLSNYIISKTQFENYRQKAMFLFNSARSSIYVADYKSAVGKLKAAAGLYFENESRKTLAGKEGPEKLQQYKFKLALLFTLTGLSYMESGEFSNAVLFYKDALSLNGDKGWIDPVNLHNGLALCYQKLGKFKLSESHLQDAEKISSGRGGDWIPKGVKITFWDYFWDFVWDVAVPDGVRISGEGRFPEAISPKFQPLMTSGIRVNNLIHSYEIEKAIEEINARLSYVKSKGLGRTLAGALIRSNSFNDLGYLRFKREEFKAAMTLYEDAEKFESDQGFVSKARISFRRGLYSFFAHLENSKEDPNLESETLQTALETLVGSKQDFVNRCLGDAQYIEEMIHSERKKCHLRFYAANPDHDPTLALVYYYLGEQFFRLGESASAFEMFGLSAGLLENPSQVPKEVVGLPADPYSRRERILHSLSRAALYVRLGDEERAKNLLELSAESANEFYYIQEWIECLVVQAEILQNEKSYTRAKEKIDKASALLLSHPHLIGELKFFVIHRLFKIQAEIYFESGRLAEGFKSLDRLHKINLYRQFVRIPHESEDSGFTADVNQLHVLLKKQKFAYAAIQNLLEKKEKSDSAQKDYQGFAKDLDKILTKIKTKNPNLDGYVGIFSEEPSAQVLLGDGEGYLRMESSNSKIKIYRAGSSTEEYLTLNGDPKEVLKQISNSGKVPFASRKVWFVQLDGGINLQSLQESLPQKHSLVFRPSHLRPLQEKDFRPLRSAALMEGSPNNDSTLRIKKTESNRILSRLLDTDLIISLFPKVEGDNSFGESFSAKELALKDLFHNRNEISSALFYGEDFEDLGKISEAYELLSASGIRNVSLCKLKQNCSENPPETVLEKPLPGNIFVGASILRIKSDYKIGNKSYESARNHERKDQIREAYSHAFSYRSVNTETSPVVSGELDLLRLKWKLSTGVSLKDIYSDVLNNKDEKDSVLFSALLTCYLDQNLQDCESYSPQDVDNLEKKNILLSLYSLRSGIPVSPESLRVSPKWIASFYDPYSYYKRILKISRNLYEWEVGDFAYNNALVLATDSEETKEVEEIQQSLLAQKYFLQGSNLSKNQIFRKEELYLILSGKWDAAFEVLKKKEAEEDTGKFRERLFLNWKREITGAWFSPYSLYSEVYGNSSKLFESLDPEERSLLYHLILYAVPFQENEEADLLANSLVEFEWGIGAKSRALRMVLGYSQALLSRGELEKSRNWIEKIGSEYKIGNEYKIIFKEKNVFLEKLDFHKNQKVGTVSGTERGEWLPLYDKVVSKPPTEFVEFLNVFVRSKKGKPFHSRDRIELLDLITFLQKLSFRKNNSEVFFDLSLAKDLVSMSRPLVLNHNADYKDIPVFASVSERLKEKLPKDQEFLSVMDLGLESFYIRFVKGKSKGDLAIKDNRKFRASLFQYLEEASRGGYEVLLREELENEYRKSIKLAKNKLTYLYLSSYHFRVPLVPRTEDRFYLVNDPESLIANPVFSTQEEFNPEYQIQFLASSKPEAVWQKTLKDLQTFEIGSGDLGSDPKSRLYVLQYPLEIVNQVSLTIGGRNVSDSLGPQRKGNWIFTSSFLDEERSDTINYRDTFYWLAQGFIGPGVIFIGEQSDTAHVDFLKRLTKRSRTKVPLYIRFQESLDAIKEAYPLDRVWNGYRLYTNSLILEE